MKVKLSKRLSAVAAFVADGNRLCDVGCDHAFLPIALVESGRIPSAIAMDVREGPLAIAERNVAEAGLDGRIETRLSDGLEMLRSGEADTILLAGMGGRLMLDILARGIEVARTAQEWVLQPQSEVAEVRRWLRLSGFAVVDEEMVCERGKYYVVLRVGVGRENAVKERLWESQGVVCVNSDKEDLIASLGGREGLFGDIVSSWDATILADSFGKILLEKKHPILKMFLEKEDKRIGRILDGFSDEENSRKKELEEEYRLVELALDYMGN